jgi:hypothetical protein
MIPVAPFARPQDAALSGEGLDGVAPWAGVLRATLIGACAWVVLLGAWLLV